MPIDDLVQCDVCGRPTAAWEDDDEDEEDYSIEEEHNSWED